MHQTRRLILLTLAPLALAVACKPDLGAPPSIVGDDPRLLAVRGFPAEAAQGAPVTYDVLAVKKDGRIASPAVTWATCHEPKPPAEANAVSSACLKIQDETPPMPTFMAAMPPTACRQFGPQPPEVEQGKPPLRPRDPDVTGGFYQPVRAVLEGESIAFALERIKCPLANVPSDITGMYNMMYKANLNPKIDVVRLDPDDAPTGIYPAAPQAELTWVSAAGAYTLEVAWPAETPESYPVWNAAAQKLDTHREALSVSWYTTEGTFEHDRTGRGESEPELATRNVWTAPPADPAAGPGPVIAHLWVVLRDSRGGVDFAGMDLEVRP